ncbi:MAG: ubiquitin-like small modifier protein 1 [Promethearchaeota archaeon]
MKIVVNFYAYLRELVGKEAKLELDLHEGAKVSHLLDELCSIPTIKEILLDENRELKSDITILKNGREIRFLDGLETVLFSGDEISIFPLVAGGNQTV